MRVGAWRGRIEGCWETGGGQIVSVGAILVLGLECSMGRSIALGSVDVVRGFVLVGIRKWYPIGILV